MSQEVQVGDILRIISIQKLRAMHIRYGCYGERVVVSEIGSKHPTRGYIVGFKFCDRDYCHPERLITWQCPMDAFEFIEGEEPWLDT